MTCTMIFDVSTFPNIQQRRTRVVGQPHFAHVCGSLPSMHGEKHGDVRGHRSQSFRSTLRHQDKSTETTTGCSSSLLAALGVSQHSFAPMHGTATHVHRCVDAWMHVVLASIRRSTPLHRCMFVRWLQRASFFLVLAPALLRLMLPTPPLRVALHHVVARDRHVARTGLEMGRPAESDPSDVASAGTDLLRGWREARDAFGGALVEARARGGCSWWSCLLVCGFVARMALWPLATVQRKAWKRPTKGWKDVGKRYCHVAVHVPVLGLASSAVRNLARLEPSMAQGGALWFQDLTQNTLGSTWDMPMGAWGTLMPLCAAAAYKVSTVPWKHAQGTAAPAHGSDMRALLADWTALGVFLASCIAPHATVCYWMGNHAAAIVQTNAFAHKDAEEMKMEALKSIVLGAKTATQGNVKHAEALFERATKLDSNQVHAWIAKASLAHQRGDNAEAERCLRTAVTIDPRVHAAFLEPFLREQKESTNPEGGREPELNEEVAQKIEREIHESKDDDTQASENDQAQTKHKS